MTNTPETTAHTPEIADTLEKLRDSIIHNALDAHQTSNTQAHQIRVADHVSELWEQELPLLLERIKQEARRKASEIAEKTRIAAPIYTELSDYLHPALQRAFANMAPLKSKNTPTTYRNSPADVADRTASDLAEAISFNTATALYERFTEPPTQGTLDDIAQDFARIAVPKVVKALTTDLMEAIDIVLNPPGEPEEEDPAPDEDPNPQDDAPADPPADETGKAPPEGRPDQPSLLTA